MPRCPSSAAQRSGVGVLPLSFVVFAPARERPPRTSGRILGWSKAKISRYELAQGGLKPADVARLLEFYGVQGGQREQLLALAEEATRRAGGRAYADVLTEGHLEYIGLEAEATSILEWQINVVPGLLQAEQYAREVLSGYQEAATISPRAIERRVETRAFVSSF